MYKLKYTGPRSYTGYGVNVSAKAPFVETDDKEIADCLVASKRFELVAVEAGDGNDSEGGQTPNLSPAKPEGGQQSNTPPGGQTSNIPEGDPGEQWTVAQLTTYATENGIELEGARTKADILAKIQEAESAINFSADV